MKAAKRGRAGMVVIACLISTVGAVGQLASDYRPPKAECCLVAAAQRLTDQLKDWWQLGRYHDDDLRLERGPAPRGRVVFLGDSITDGWDLAHYFPGKPYVNRGISGQTTPQMLVRFYPDVIDLRPGAVIILAGTNDVAGNTGPETATMVEENMRAMTELAQHHGIRVILCTLTPVSDYTQEPQTVRRPPADIRALNDWIRTYAAQTHIGVADYYPALVDASGMLRRGYSDDGLHPNASGYELMAPVAQHAIDDSLQRR